MKLNGNKSSKDNILIEPFNKINYTLTINRSLGQVYKIFSVRITSILILLLLSFFIHSCSGLQDIERDLSSKDDVVASKACERLSNYVLEHPDQISKIASRVLKPLQALTERGNNPLTAEALQTLGLLGPAAMPALPTVRLYTEWHGEGAIGYNARVAEERITGKVPINTTH